MNNRFLTRWTLCVVLVLLLGWVSVPALHAELEVRVQVLRDGLILVPVTANGEGPFYFLLDTGADTTIVDAALGKKLGLTALESIKQATVTGSRSVAVSRVTLAVGGMRVDALPVLEQDLVGLRRVDGRIVGVVGQNFLSRFNYLVDYRAQVVRFEEGNEIGSGVDGDRLAWEAGSGRMVVTADTDGLTSLRLLLDSGADAVVLSGAAAGTLRLKGRAQGVETSSVGAAVMRTGRLGRLTVAAREFRDVPVSVMPEGLGGVADGLLPASLFDALYVNNARGFVVLNPRLREGVEVAMR